MFRTARLLFGFMVLGFMLVTAASSAYSSAVGGTTVNYKMAQIPAVVDATQVVCMRLGQTRFVSGCHVNDQASSVSFTLNVASDKAAKLCADASKGLASMVPSLVREGWSVRIFSPYDTQRAMSTCGIG